MTTDGITGVMEILMDGDGTILVIPVIMVAVGVNHGDGTDGTTGVTAASDLDGTAGGLAGTIGDTVVDIIMDTDMVTEIDTITVTIDSQIEITH